MNEEMEKAMSALAGGVAPAGNAAGEDTTDWKAKYEETQRELDSARVEQGRVKKLAEEKKALEAKVAELSASGRAQEALSALPEDIREDMPESVAKGTSLIAQKAVEAAMAARDAELAQLKAQMTERDQRSAKAVLDAFGVRIEQEFPGFLLNAVSASGKNHAAWVNYQRYNAESINTAFRAGDFDKLSWHIRKFYVNELGIAAPSGGSGAAAPDPSATGGGTPVAPHPGKVYTEQEISDLYDEVEKARDRGDFAEVKRLGAEIDKAVREGRVKQ